jgi:hypothetical protein
MTEIFKAVDFKAVEWMRRVRVQIDTEDIGLAWSDKHRKTAEILEKDPIWQRLKHRITDFQTSKGKG